MKRLIIDLLIRYMEKALLAAGLLVLVVVGFGAFFGDPLTVEIDTLTGRKTAGPADIETFVSQAADKLDAQVSSNKVAFDPPVIPDYKSEFGRAYQAVPIEVASLNPMTWVAPALGEVTDSAPTLDLPAVPTPTGVVASADYGLLLLNKAGDSEVQSELIRVSGAGVPADVRYVSVGAVFDMAGWARRFEGIPADRRVPRLVYNNALYVTGVYLIRQQWDPALRQWGASTRIDPLPTQPQIFSFQPLEFDRAGGEQMVGAIRSNPGRFARPPFPPLAPVRPWRQPPIGMNKLGVEVRQRLIELRIEIGEKEQAVLARRRELGLIEQLPADPASRTDGGEAGVIGQRGTPSTADAPALEDEVLAGLEASLVAMYRERAALAPMAAQADDAGTPDGSVEIWAHDLSVQPDQTYRYKVVAEVLNPLFQYQRVDPAQIEENRNRIALAPSKLAIEAAEWSEPVTIEPRFQFFAVAGSPENQIAEVEVYTIFDGAWRRQIFNISPGDPIGGFIQWQTSDGRSAEVDMRTGALLVDIVPMPVPEGGISSARLYYQYEGASELGIRDVAVDKESTRRKLLLGGTVQGALAPPPDAP